MARGLQISKANVMLSVGLNFGFAQVGLAFGTEMEREKVGRIAEIDYASTVGPSPMGLGRTLDVVQYFLGKLKLGDEMHMDDQSVLDVLDQMRNVSFELGIIPQEGVVKVLEAKLDFREANPAMIASLFLCITHTVGGPSAVRCIKSFLMKLNKEVNGAWLERYLDQFHKDLDLLGPISKLEDEVNHYIEYFEEGRRHWNETYVKPVEKVVEALLEKLLDNTGSGSPSVWYTRSRKVHKLAYLLCFMGWNVSVEPYSDRLPEPYATKVIKVIVRFTEETHVDGDLIEAKLYSAGVGAPTRLTPSVENEQGPGVRLQEDGLVHGVRTVVEYQRHPGKVTENAWQLGYHIGEKCKVELVFSETECNYRFGDSTLRHEVGECWPAVDEIITDMDRSLAKYGPMLHKLLGGSASEYDNPVARLQNIFNTRKAENFESTGNTREDEIFGQLVAFYLGFVYGKLRALLVATGLKDANGNWAKDPLEFRVGWMEFMGQFLYDVRKKLWVLSKVNAGAPRMHSVFSFIGMCCSSKSIYFGKEVELEDIVGLWTGTSLVMLATAMKPGIDPKRGANLENYPQWLLNLSTVDGVHLQSSKWIESGTRVSDLPTAGAPPTLHFEIPPKAKLNIYLSPNFVEGNATLVHCMMCKGDIVYVAPVMGALVNLHKKTIECSSARRSGPCDGTDDRLRSCRGGLPIYVGEFMLGTRSYVNNGGNADMPEEVGVIMARDDIPWRYAATCIYHDTHFVIAGSCLSCAREGMVDGKWGEYII